MDPFKINPILAKHFQGMPDPHNMIPGLVQDIDTMIRDTLRDTAQEKIRKETELKRFKGGYTAYCSKHIYPGSKYNPSSRPTVEGLQKEVSSLSQKVLLSWATLGKIVERHSNALEKRWNKKTKTKQRELLLRAWPNMSPSHHPEIEAHLKWIAGPADRDLKEVEDAYTFPYVNLRDLSSKSLLLFVHNRALNPPSAFARSDINVTYLGSMTHSIEEPAFLCDHTLYMDGDTVETYGKLVMWSEDKKAFDLMISSRQFTPGDGLRVLKMQERIYNFLVSTCELILYDLIGEGTLFDDRYPILERSVELSTLSILPPKIKILPSLATASNEAQYCLPAKFDLKKIRGIIAARLSTASDHLWALREDPRYFADTVLDWSEHRFEKVLDKQGKEFASGPGTKEFWQRVIRNIISKAYKRIITWDILLRNVQRLCELQEQFKKEISYEKDLPKRFLSSILRFQSQLRKALEAPLCFLKDFKASPPFRDAFCSNFKHGSTTYSLVPSNGSERYDEPEFVKPHTLFQHLWSQPHRDLFGVSILIDVFEHEIVQEPAYKKMITPHIMDLVSDIGIIGTVWKELENCQPWAATFEQQYQERQKSIMQFSNESFKPASDLNTHMHVVLEGVVEFGIPLDGKFYYPVEKPRTNQMTDTMRTAEKNLDEFWRVWDKNWKKLTGKSINTSILPHTFPWQGETLERTAPWAELSKSVKQVSVANGTKQPQDLIRGIALDKTVRGPALPPAFKVDTVALKVFNTLFHEPKPNETPVDIQWRHFIHAMASADFAPQKMYGNIWQFTPAKMHIDQSIQFTEPPGVKIPYTVARRMGRRLTRNFGWHRGLFELE